MRISQRNPCTATAVNCPQSISTQVLTKYHFPMQGCCWKTTESIYWDCMVQHKNCIATYNVNPLSKRCQCPCCAGNPRELVLLAPNQASKEDKESDNTLVAQVPVGVRFAKQPNAATIRHLPQLAPVNKPPPLPMALAPPQQSP